MQNAKLQPPARFDRRARPYRFKLWCYTHPHARPVQVERVAMRLGIQGWRGAYFDIEQTRQVLRDIGVILPGDGGNKS